MTRLARARALIAGSGGRPPPARPEPWRADVGVHLARVAGDLGGEVSVTPDGPCLVIRRSYDAAERYGRRVVGAYPRPGAETLALVGGLTELPDPHGPRVVYFDLETTGLSGGAGTVAFLFGFGWFDGGAFHTCQYLLPTLSAERQVLGVSTLVTFNGKSFDVPMTEARFAFHRMTSPLDGLDHVDLLHPARRVWPANETRLTGLEQTVLGVRRRGDVPGEEIPARYVAFLRGGDPRLVSPVLEHNRLDLVSLGLLTGLACEIVGEGVSATHGNRQALGLGRLYEKAGRVSDAVECYQVAAKGTTVPDARAEALRRLALCHRRDRRYDEAAERWSELLAVPGLSRRATHEASVALAVHHEHRLRDLPMAERFATRALAHEPQTRRRLALEHRVRRITRKLERAQRGQDEMSSLLRSDR